MLFIGGTGWGVSVMCAILGVQLKYVCSLLCYVSLQLLFVHFRYLLLVGFCRHRIFRYCLDIVVLLTDTYTYCNVVSLHATKLYRGVELHSFSPFALNGGKW